MAEVTARIDSVETYDGVAKSSGKPYTRFTVKAGGRKYDTFRREIAEPAAPLKGQLAVIVYSERQNGEYTNYDLEGVKAAPGVAGATETAAQGTVETQAVSNGSNVRSVPAASPRSAISDKDVSIARAVALKAAVETATGLQLVDADAGSIITIADTYLPWLLTGEAKTANPFADLAIQSSDDPVTADGELVKF